MFRLLLALSVAVFPVFGWTQNILDPSEYDPLWMRLVFSGVAAILLTGSYHFHWVRTQISQLTSAFLCLVSFWYVVLAYASGFSPESAVSLIVIFAAVGVGTSFWIQSIALISTYMLTMITVVGVAVYSLDAPGLQPSAMMIGCFGVGFVIFIAVASREKADEDMYAQHGLLRSLFDESTDAHILFDSLSGRVIDFNQAALDLLEVSDEMLTCRKLDWRTGLDVLDCEGAIDDGSMEHRERKCIARSGRIFWADVSTRSLHVDDLEITLLKIADITQKREAACTAILDARRAAAIAELSAALTSARIDDEDPLQIVASSVTRWEAELCIICCLSEAGDAITPMAISHRNPEMENVVRTWADDAPMKPGEGLIGRVVSAGQSLMLDHEETTEFFSLHDRRLLNEAYLHHVVVYPLLAYGKPVGAILIARDTQRGAFTEHDLTFFNDVVEKTGLAIANVRLLNAVKRSEVRFRSLVQNSSDLILLLDHNGKFRYVSPAARRILGYTPDELIGERIFSLAHPDDVKGLLSESTNVREGKQVVVNASRFRHANGEWRWLEAFAVNMLHDENVKGVVINARDVTDRIRYEDDLRTARDTAEEMVRMKDAFLANMSHEIRTPLTAILGFSSILADELDAEHHEFVGHIHSNGTRLLDALNSVLDLARLESGGVPLELTEVDVHQSVHAAVTALRSLAADRGLTLEASTGTQPLPLRLDSACLDRILTNLLGNAIRFTNDGGIRVVVATHPYEVEISVEDTGIGIGDEFLPHLFTPFRQESSGYSRSHEGTGLGLAITQRLVEIMGGNIEVESRRGAGSIFRVRFPREAADHVEIAATNAAERSRAA